MFKTKSSQPLFFAVSFIAFLSAFLIILKTKPKILDWFYLPLEVSSSFIRDTRAIVTYKFILNENYRLRDQAGRVKSDAAFNEELLRENQRLKKLVSFKEQFQSKAVCARVIAREPGNWSRGVMLNKGANDRINIGDFVLAESALAGRVIEVSARTAKVILINDPESSVAAFIQRSREEGLVSGTLLGEVIMRYLEKDSDCMPGDAVMVSRLDQAAPFPVLIGAIKEVKEEPQGLAKYCVVTPAADLRRIEEVLVVGSRQIP